MSGKVLIPTLLPPDPALFRSSNETERIGLLIQRIIPQCSFRNNDETDSSLLKLRNEIRGGGKENRSELELGDEPASKKRRNAEKGTDV